MSIQSCTDFLHQAQDSAEIAHQLKAMTAPQEIVKLAHRNGYSFDLSDLAKASTSFRPPPHPGATPPAEPPTRPATSYHYEYKLADIPALAGVIDELPKLKVRPATVDLAAFNRDFREEDLRSTARSPTDPAYQVWHDAMLRQGWRDPALDPDAPRRDFHLINLDEHTEHPDYEQYFAAKVRTIALLEDAFNHEIRFSGSMWYPPSSYRLWHTNEYQPGWRMYIIDFDRPFPDPTATSFFRYQNPLTKQLVTLPESPQLVRFFKPERDPAKLFWHCIVNPTSHHRWSFGFVIPDHWMDSIG